MKIFNLNKEPGVLTLPVLVLYTILLTFLSLMPGDSVKTTITGIDKVFHFILYSILAFLIFRFLIFLKKPQKLANKTLLCISSGSIYGIIMEIMQGFSPNRTPDSFDALANFLGCIAGSLLYLLILRKQSKNN